MIKTFEIVAKFDIPEELKNKYVGDEAVCEELKEILLEEIGEEIKPEITVNVLDSESVPITKEEYEELKEKAWRYDELSK